MKYQLIFLSVILMAFSACTKVVKIDLNGEDPKYVIEGNISDAVGPAVVKISRSVNFDQSNDFPKVSNAQVILSDDAGHRDTLLQTVPGEYQALTLQGTPGRTYTLQVQVDGKQFTSISTMPYPTPLDTINVLNFGFGGPDQKALIPVYKDSAGIKNYYRFIVYKNTERQDDIHINDDQFADGLVAQQPLFGRAEYKSGDEVTIAMQGIDYGAYLYFYSLLQNTGGGATPANPVSNIQGGALGYFSAHCITAKSITIQ
ncbi:MAG TPA: DUF4249 domain-containing protein [Chitinophagaceae bacterium]|nr:DUF4249 domain-containing protein [Chitinophagaceae bacterium]